LFAEKAKEWFWRYRDSVQKIEWKTLCKALKKHYVGHLSDYDIKELIKERKQLPTENFEDFYSAVMNLSDRLTNRLDEKELVEMMRRNLKPYLQKELLYKRIRDIDHLRNLVLKRELLNQNLDKRKEERYNKKYIAEIIQSDSEESSEDEVCEVEHRKRKEPLCWNCREEGHRYIDCMKERTIFCYGCGAQNKYKPTCENCLKNPKRKYANPKN
jgi:hypothetical protein